MALRDQPYIPLYVQDYLTDEKLNSCSAASQGVYIKIMCVFHKSEPYGGILLKQKDKQKSSSTLNFVYKLARLLPFDAETIENALTELLEEKVLQIDGDFLSQKRMVHDNTVSLSRSEAGRKGGGNPNFVKTKSQTKRLTKRQQNPEIDIVNENVIELKEKEVQEEKPKEMIKTFPFSTEFIPHWVRWIEYKSGELGFRYKKLQTEQAAFHDLVRMSKENEAVAVAMIDKAIGNKWKGFYEIKNDNSNSKPGKRFGRVSESSLRELNSRPPLTVSRGTGGD